MKRDGFTLIEIILAIAFLLIVTLMVVPNMYTMIAKSNEKQLEKTNAIIEDAAKLYVGMDRNLAYNIKRCGRNGESGTPNLPTCHNTVGSADEIESLYKNVYISLYDLVRFDLLSANLKDPTQNSSDFDYSKVVNVWYNTDPAVNDFVYDLKERQSIVGIDKRTLMTQTYLVEYDYFWYSGLKWRAYKITDTLDGTNQVSPEEDDYIHLYMDETDPYIVDLTCSDVEAKLNKYKNVLAKRTDNSYCSNDVVAVHPVTVVLKNRQMFLGGTGTVSNPFVLLGDSGARDGQRIYERYIGEYILTGGSIKRIIAKDINALVVSDTTNSVISLIDGDLKIRSDDNGNLGIGTYNRPYTLGS